MIYLDNAATTLKKPDTVLKAMTDAFKNCASVGRGGHEVAMNAAEIVFAAREVASEMFGASGPEQVVFTSNATHSLNLAIKGIAKAGNCVISGYEHNSVVRPIMTIPDLECRVAKGGLFQPESIIRSFERQIDKNTSFAVCTHMSNVFGYILPIKRIDEICYRKGIPLIIDASQSAGSVRIKLNELKACQCICMPGHKGLYGPQGTGILICRNGEDLKTVFEGGTGSVSKELTQPDFMPDRLECGTHNVPGIAGLAAGISYIKERGEGRILRHERNLISEVVRELRKMEGVSVFASCDGMIQGGVLSFVSDRMSSERIANELSVAKTAVRSGFHCSPLAHETVRTADGTVRVSVSNFTERNDIYEFAKQLKKIV